MTPERLAEIEQWADSPPLAELKVSKAEEGWIQGGKNTARSLIAHIRDLEAQVREARDLIRGITDTLEPYEGRLRVRGGWAEEFWGSIAEAEEYTRATATPPSLSAKERQRRSFAYGNVHIDNPNVTREMVDRVAERLASKPPSPEVGA